MYPEDAYANEECRVASFHHLMVVDTRRLARAGFVFTRNDIMVRCYVCGYEFNAMEITTNIEIRHRPDCPLLPDKNSEYPNQSGWTKQ